MATTASPFTAKDVPANVQAELRARETVTAANNWFATRTNWVHIRSFCDQCTEDVKILYSMKESIYQKNSSGDPFTGLRPNPVIESVQIKAQGNLGTTRTCVIKIIAFTQEQVNALAACYGVPSMSVRVQFGWNMGADGTLSPQPFGDIRTNTQATCKIKNLRELSPCYDGLQGIVGKWGVTFVKESMWWEFSIEIIAASQPVLNRPLEDVNSICYCDRTSQNPQTGEAEKSSQGTSNFRAIIIDMIENPSNYEDNPNVYIIHLNHAERDQLGAQASGFFKSMAIMAADLVGTAETDEPYIPFSYLQQLINDYSFNQVGKEPLEAKFDSSKMGLLTWKIGSTYSSDPDVCLLPGLDVVFEDGLDGIQSAPACKVIAASSGIDINKILVNCIFINKTIEGLAKNASIQDFLDQILSGISTAVGGLFELTIVDTGGCDAGEEDNIQPTLSVVDLQKIKKDKVKPYKLPAGPDKAVLRDVKLELKLTDAMKSQALYAGERQNSNSSPCDEARFKNEVRGYRNITLQTPVTQPKKECPTDCKTKEEHEAEKPTLLMDYLDMISETTDARKETVRARMVDEFNKKAEETNCKEVIVPYELSFTVDGIGGFAFGQLVTCDLLPEKVAKKYVYQITSVEHSLTYGDWVTTVSTVARYA